MRVPILIASAVSLTPLTRWRESTDITALDLYQRTSHQGPVIHVPAFKPLERSSKNLSCEIRPPCLRYLPKIDSDPSSLIRQQLHRHTMSSCRADSSPSFPYTLIMPPIYTSMFPAQKTRICLTTFSTHLQNPWTHSEPDSQGKPRLPIPGPTPSFSIQPPNR